LKYQFQNLSNHLMMFRSIPSNFWLPQEQIDDFKSVLTTLIATPNLTTLS